MEEQLLCGTAFLRRPSIFIEHCFRRTCRSSHRSWSIKKEVLRKFAKFTGKHLCQSLFLFQRCKRDCATGVVNFAKFLRETFLRTPLGDCFWTWVTAICDVKNRKQRSCSETRFVLVWCVLFFINHFLRSVLF